jgi:hypothetical protein
MRAILLVAFLLVAGCAGSQTWAKPGGTQADLDRDTYECERDARMLPSGSQYERIKFSEQCLRSKGWTLVK